MKHDGIHRLAAALKVLVTAVWVCNLLILPFAPMIAANSFAGGTLWDVLDAAANGPSALLGQTAAAFAQPYPTLLSAALLFCGVCSAVMLWQARRIVDTILQGFPFSWRNGESFSRAAVRSFLISGVSLIASGAGFAMQLSPPTYAVLFVPFFFIVGLLFLVLAALFYEAADLKHENDLTI